MESVNYKELVNRKDELMDLINSANRELNEQSMTLNRDFNSSISKYISEHTSQAAYMAQQTMKKGGIDAVVVGGALFLAAEGATKLVDVAGNAYSKRKAKEALLSYYAELTTKQNMIIQNQDEYARQSMEYSQKLIAAAEEDRQRYLDLYNDACEKYNELAVWLKKCIEFQKNVKK